MHVRTLVIRVFYKLLLIGIGILRLRDPTPYSDHFEITFDTQEGGK